jgi:CRP-like cAMP-binding protein
MAERRDLTSRALHLRSIPVTAELEPRVVHPIAAALREQVFEAGAYLMREGEPCPAFHLMLDGSAKVIRGGKDFGKLAAPQGVGFVSVLAGGDAPYDAIAEVDTAVLTLDKDALNELMEDHPSMLVAILRYAAQRLYHEMRELSVEGLRMPFGEARSVPDRPLDFVERILFLRSVSVFSRTNLNALASLSSQLEEVRLPAGTELFREADEDVAASYWIVSGSITCESSIGPRSWRYGPTTVVGGIEGIAGMPRWYRASTDEPLVALRGYAHQFIETLEDDFPTARTFVAMMATGLQAYLVAKGAAGLAPVAAPREMERLGSVPVGV